MPSNPDVEYTDESSRAQTWLKPTQVERLRDVCLSDVIALLYDAGLRAGELCALDLDHLDLENGTVYLSSAIQKGSPPPATLELKPETVRLLRRYLRDRWKDTTALFPTRSSDRITTRSGELTDLFRIRFGTLWPIELSRSTVIGLRTFSYDYGTLTDKPQTKSIAV